VRQTRPHESRAWDELKKPFLTAPACLPPHVPRPCAGDTASFHNSEEGGEAAATLLGAFGALRADPGEALWPLLAAVDAAAAKLNHREVYPESGGVGRLGRTPNEPRVGCAPQTVLMRRGLEAGSNWTGWRLDTRPHVEGQADSPLPPPPRTEWTRLVPPPVLTGHVSSLPPY